MRNTTKILYSIYVVILCVIMAICGLGNLSAFADSADMKTAYENTNVYDNLKDSTIAGKKFSVEDYKYVAGGKMQLLSLVEFCYSYYADKQENFGLYLYIYNPSHKLLDTNTESNKIKLSCGSLQTKTYKLKFLNYSNIAGQEPRFYKFKIDIDRQEVLKSLDGENREYKVTCFDLSSKGFVECYTTAQKYTYTGYAKGYGSELSTTNSLKCAVDGFDKYLGLNVTHTFYRPEGDYYNGEQDQLNSVFFRVPNEYYINYGELSKIACEWYEYFTKPILVTNDKTAYDLLDGLHGADISNLSDKYALINIYWEKDKILGFNKGTGEYISNYPYEDRIYKWMIGLVERRMFFLETDIYGRFSAVFYAPTFNLDEYEISGEELQIKLLKNSKNVGGTTIDGASGTYSKALFENYVQNGYSSGYNYKEINATDTFKLTSNTLTKNIWQKMWGGFDIKTTSFDTNAIINVTANDLIGTDKQISERLLIHEKDIAKLKAEFRKANNKESVVLFRFSSTKYLSARSIVGYCNKSDTNPDEKMVHYVGNKFADNNFNAYVAQETVYLNFDIISLWFTAEDGAETEIPVAMTPMDIINDITPPPKDPFKGGCNDFKSIISIVLVVLLLILLAPILPLLIQIIMAVVTLPIKLILALFKRRRG